MRNIIPFAGVTFLCALVLLPIDLSAGQGKKAGNAKPYPLEICVVSEEKLGADPGMKPYTFAHEGQEVKLCCKSCLKDFKKDPAKFMAKIQAADKKPK